jgi:tyrosine-protein phosphatase non-receptor type 1
LIDADVLFQEIRRDSSQNEHTTVEASRPENRTLNRYRDVYPYDHSRVTLVDCDTDYINASLVKVNTQGRRPARAVHEDR